MPATTLASVATGQDSNTSRNLVNGNLVSGKVGVLNSTYAMLGTEAAGDLIKIGTIPKGATLLVEEWRVASEGSGGTTGTIATIGTLANDDEYSATAAAITAAGNVAVTPIAGLPPAQLTAATAVYGKLGLASGSFTAGKVLNFRIKYILP